MLKNLHIDIETFSSVDIKTSGAYKYVESIDFEILLIAYAFDQEPIQLVDLAQGDEMPEEFIKALQDPTIRKHAHNATFERLAFRAIGYDVSINHWYCSAVKAAYCGLPLSLANVSEALELGDKGKLSTGKALIKYFCVPCKPTKVNGGRTSNQPHHNLEKWAQFCEYCVQDVEAEREITRILSPYTIPGDERLNYILDQEINDRGILIDLGFARSAVALDSRYTDIVKTNIKDITELDNPNSLAQLKSWLKSQTGEEINSLSKDEVPQLIEKFGGVVGQVLKMRQKISKSSTKKYKAMLNCACESNRAHGLFQFYGANRTGRWAGRLIQLQNLPRNYMKDLDLAREIMDEGDYSLADLILGDISSVLSELIRTAFIAKPGHTFAVADFSAIEARVIAWLAGEEWRLKVFKTHGKIYEASAAMMFAMNVDEVGKGSMHRQAGKVAELALGYQGGDNALRSMGKGLGLNEELVDSIISMGTIKKWRTASPAIVQLWKDLEEAAKRALKNKDKVFKCKCLSLKYDGSVLMIKLPSGRCLFYQSPKFGVNRFGKDAIKYKGMNQTTGKWGYQDTYGGKLTENVVQAIARDLLAFSMQNLDKAGYNIVMHVHDEAACEIDLNYGPPEESLANMCQIMAIGPEWAKGLPLNADGYITPYYKKD